MSDNFAQFRDFAILNLTFDSRTQKQYLAGHHVATINTITIWHEQSNSMSRPFAHFHNIDTLKHLNSTQTRQIHAKNPRSFAISQWQTYELITSNIKTSELLCDICAITFTNLYTVHCTLDRIWKTVPFTVCRNHTVLVFRFIWNLCLASPLRTWTNINHHISDNSTKFITSGFL